MADECYAFPLMVPDSYVSLVAERYEFQGGLALIRTDERAQAVGEEVITNPHYQYGSLFAHWMLVVPMPERNTQFEEQGISRFEVAHIIAEGFFAAIRILMCGDVDGPQAFRGTIDSEGDLRLEPLKDAHEDFVGKNVLPPPKPDIDDPPVHVHDDDPRFALGMVTMTRRSLDDEDVPELDAVWGGISKLRGLDNLAGAFSEASFRQLDHGIKGSRQLSPVDYAKQFRRNWAKHLEVTQNRSRLGRALQLFDDAMMTPSSYFWPRPTSELTLFLQMFLVLESLFNTGESDIGRTISLRAAKLLAGTKHLAMHRDAEEHKGKDRESEVERMYGKTKKLYTLRNSIVHGRKNVPTPRKEDKKDKQMEKDGAHLEHAWLLARLCLVRILGDPESECFRALASTVTKQRKGGKRAKGKDDDSASNFYRGLELHG